MELLVPTTLLCKISTLSLFCSCSNLTFNGGRIKFYGKPNRGICSPFRISSKSEQESTSNDYLYQNLRDDDDISWGKGSNSVQVVGIGSRKDAILDYCLDSPFQSSLSTLRFWTILSKDSFTMQLQQRSLGKDVVSRIVELSALQLSAPRAVILVASAGYGLDHIAAIEFLRTVKATNGLAVGIVLKPFSFEGQKRQDEVSNIVKKIREYTNFCIVVDTDALLKKEVMTLAEALKNANNAVLLAINCIFILMSERQNILFYPTNKRKELEVSEVINLLESFQEAKVGFGAGNNIKSSIARAVFDCPFIGGGIKDLNGTVVCTLASATVTESSDLNSFLQTFRQTTGWQKDVVFSIVCEPNLEPNLFVTTILALGNRSDSIPQKNGFLSGLALRFPFVFSILGRDRREPKEESLPAHSLESPRPSEESSNSPTGYSQSFELPEEVQTLFGSSYDESNASSGSNTEDKRTEIEILKASNDSAGQYAFERESLASWNADPSFHIRHELDKERATISGSSPVFDNQYMYTLPVGVKPSEQSIDGPQLKDIRPFKQKTFEDVIERSLGTLNRPSLDVVTDTSLEGKSVGAPRKQGLLSTRAASMLEFERDSQKKWSPIMEMQYRGGIYRGRCQGGLPEGKGRLTLVDGSIYDGMWRYGKRSGLGTFYYSNGDVFQGSWRDDLMHGKGWFYFNSGDRWFANYWKGKANGEGRFYSKDGEIFFGHFQDGWRHGRCLCISVDGTRKRRRGTEEESKKKKKKKKKGEEEAYLDGDLPFLPSNQIKGGRRFGMKVCL